MCLAFEWRFRNSEITINNNNNNLRVSNIGVSNRTLINLGLRINPFKPLQINMQWLS